MRFGVLADTHDNVDAIERALEIFDHEGITTLVHCGDYIAPPVLPYFDGLTLHGVLGNNDGERDGLERGFDALGNDSQLHGRYADLTLGRSNVFVLHGDQGRDTVEEYARTGAYDYVLYGHYHERDHRTVGDTTVINPGGHFPTVPTDHRTVVTVDPSVDEVHFHSLTPVE